MGDAALIMAGGNGLRMTASGGSAPKPLTVVAGATLLEHNLRQLARHGFDRVTVAVQAGGPVRAFVGDQLTRTAERLAVTLETLVERTPRGNIGAVGNFGQRTEPVLVVFADNLTTLDLRHLFDQHRRSDPALTAATHRQSFRMPFGEVTVADGRIVGYREKPTTAFTVCSAICALAPRAMAAVRPSEMLGLSDLINRLLGLGERIDAYEHDAPWIDVNDQAAAAEAERLLAQHAEAFGIEEHALMRAARS